MLTFNDALIKLGADPREVALIFHTPLEPAFRRALPWLVQERRALFEYFQSYHSRSVEPTLKKRPLMAAFVAVENGHQAFVGLYERVNWRERPIEELEGDPSGGLLNRDFGVPLLAEHCRREGVAAWTFFDFRLTDKLASLQGRLMVEKPTGRRYVRLADNLAPEIIELTAGPALVAPPPDWRHFILSAPEIATLPGSWSARLAEWRGVYLIADTSDGARYVGSAYGENNLLGRWRAHVQGDHGVTAELSRRETRGFRFSILERVSPDMEARDVIEIENNWKLRLDTIANGLNRQ